MSWKEKQKWRYDPSLARSMKVPYIIALSGKKGAGKNTLAEFIEGYFQSLSRVIRHSQQLSFADEIKSFCINVLGLDYEQCYGSDDQKNTPTQYLWENILPQERTYDRANKTGRMTGREVMQIFGTECVRKWFGNVWAEATVRKILREGLDCAIVTDNRFPNEAETILGQPEGYIIRLTRSPYSDDEHESEIALDDFNWNRPKCFILGNAHMSREEQTQAVIPILQRIFRQGAE